MCGIVGVVTADSNRERLVGPMLESLSHRGPDGVGVWKAQTAWGKAIALGHRRLSILDLTEAGSQPMVDVSRQLSIT